MRLAEYLSINETKALKSHPSPRDSSLLGQGEGRSRMYLSCRGNPVVVVPLPQTTSGSVDSRSRRLDKRTRGICGQQILLEGPSTGVPDALVKCLAKRRQISH